MLSTLTFCPYLFYVFRYLFLVCFNYRYNMKRENIYSYGFNTYCIYFVIGCQ